MKTGQILLLTLAVAAAGLAAWFFLGPEDLMSDSLDTAEHPKWQFEATEARLIGDLEDPFAYAGGEATRLLEGSAELQLEGSDLSGALRASVALDGSATVLAASIDPSARLELRGTLNADRVLAVDQAIHGETGLGDPRLPEVRALLAGTADLEVFIDGTPRGVTYRSVWSVAEALRREDGAIRNQGLTFSPLLRDSTVFADRSRLEVTLLVYSAEPSAELDSVILHLVYGDVNLLAAPEDIAIP